MRNLDQLRAATAIKFQNREFGGEEGGNILDGFPALVVNNGLMAALAFCMMKAGKGKGYKTLGEAVVAHLTDKNLNLGLSPNTQDLQGLLDFLSKADSDVLRVCTAETLMFLNFLRRFVKARSKD
jgi:CRISPR/Cas system CMR-associated protein Cmr5 small subunit